MVLSNTQQGSMARYLEMKGQLRPPKKAGIVAYSGIRGCYAEAAGIKYFGPDCLFIPHKSFEDVLKSVSGGGADYGVLPIENSTTGAINDVYDLLIRYRAAIVGEVLLPIRHCLLGTADADLSTVRTVYSHEQGFYQSRDFLAKYPDWRQVPYHNTAVAAKLVADAHDPAKAAIASARAAEIHGLKILAENINAAAGNTTRFIVVAKRPEICEGRNKISLRFILPDEPGALYRLLGIFEKENLNLSKIESRPIPGSRWHYQFFLDFIGSLDQARLDHIIADVMRRTKAFEFLGFYPGAGD
ncbi:prephenate dehydratase [Pseudoramibacter sp.]|jgi:chorismate mutase/prephenate dehydratase|uniref:prephenate dehydratase n=1 Tax=Pseudoramibacter sp. TaxID=2034862 RepID=UPI0026014C92|nr:prephenate dehydratase domain-containing protein [Pseudoramibacter sp.]MCH4071621.1 ACT domain-containing protein [Pseudoramibacter sp.]MCH4105389.1 ACT domain-containing protein [Pseudoramibacter sp.]